MNRKCKRVLQGVILLAGITTLVTTLPAATYRCEQDGVVTYSDTRCGPAAQQSEAVQNSYPGALRPGEQELLNEAATRRSTGTGSSQGSGTSDYGERIREQNERRKAEGDKRRIPRESNSPWH